jgi:hypothetical protein
MGRSVYKQPGTKVDEILPQQGGFQVSTVAEKRHDRSAKKHFYLVSKTTAMELETFVSVHS